MKGLGLGLILVWAAVSGRPVQDRSSLTVVVDDVWLLVIDPQGARTGLDPTSGKEVQEIPRSVVFVDAIDDDVTGEAATSFTAQVIINQPPEGMYRVVVVGQGGPSQLAVHAFSTDGSAQPRIAVPVSPDTGSRAEFRLHNGIVVGGHPMPTGEGFYYVRLEAARRLEPLALAVTKLWSLPGVAGASLVTRFEEQDGRSDDHGDFGTR